MGYPYYTYGGMPYNQGSYQPQQMAQAQMQLPSQDERIWVQGKLSADAYLVAPNSFVRLWDNSQNVFYEKRADATGRPYMETYEYKLKRNDVSTQASREQDNRIDYAEKINALEMRINALEKGSATNVSKSDGNDATVSTV